MDLRQTDPTPLLGARQARSARFSESPGLPGLRRGKAQADDV